jgi:hypothetical protein
MRGYLARYEEKQIKSRQYDRNGPIKLKWQDRARLVGELFIDDALWARVEWSETRQQWCIEDSQGRCLTHVADLRGTADSKQGAIELAEQMIRDGRLPTPAEVLERRDAERERRRARPSEVRRQERRTRERELWHECCAAAWEERKAQPLYEALAEAFDFSDPLLWRSNSFGSLRPRLVIWMQAVVLDLECDVERQRRPPAKEAEAKLARAREILGWLKGEQVRSEAA